MELKLLIFVLHRKRNTKKIFKHRNYFNFMQHTFAYSALILSRTSFAHLLRLDAHPEFITYSALIIALDTLSTLPFAKLRHEQRPRKYALIRISQLSCKLSLLIF